MQLAPPSPSPSSSLDYEVAPVVEFDRLFDPNKELPRVLDSGLCHSKNKSTIRIPVKEAQKSPSGKGPRSCQDGRRKTVESLGCLVFSGWVILIPRQSGRHSRNKRRKWTGGKWKVGFPLSSLASPGSTRSVGQNATGNQSRGHPAIISSQMCSSSSL